MVTIKTYAKHIRKNHYFHATFFNLIFYQLSNFGLLINFRAHLLQVCTYFNMIEWYVWFVSSCTYLYSDIMYLERERAVLFMIWCTYLIYILPSIYWVELFATADAFSTWYIHPIQVFHLYAHMILYSLASFIGRGEFYSILSV